MGPEVHRGCHPQVCTPVLTQPYSVCVHVQTPHVCKHMPCLHSCAHTVGVHMHVPRRAPGVVAGTGGGPLALVTLEGRD